MSHKKIIGYTKHVHTQCLPALVTFVTSNKPTHTIFLLTARRDELLHNTEPQGHVSSCIFSASLDRLQEIFLGKYYAL